MSHNEIVYGIGILIILLMVVWFFNITYEICDKDSYYKHNRHRKKYYNNIQNCENMNNKISTMQKNIKPGGLIYGGKKIKIGNSNNSSNIKLNEGMVGIPNSKTVTRDLMIFDNVEHVIDKKDDEFSTMHLIKKSKEKYSNPLSLTGERIMHSDSYDSLKPIQF
jgi:hypothetical protein